jgi:hypothetical protein
MPFIALINEGSIGYAKAEARETPAMQAAWAAWLAEQRAKDPAYAEIPDKMPLRMSGREGAAVARFVADTEARMVARMKAFLREEIGCRALISNYNCGTHYTTLQPVREALYDYVDDHFYVDHPNFLDKRWALPSRCGNENPLRTGCTVPCGVAFTRLANKPVTVSEYNFSGPGMYRGVGGIMTGAMGALQDWSALWRFAYSHRLENMFSSEGFAGYFDVATDPLSQASDRASICLSFAVISRPRRRARRSIWCLDRTGTARHWPKPLGRSLPPGALRRGTLRSERMRQRRPLRHGVCCRKAMRMRPVR